MFVRQDIPTEHQVVQSCHAVYHLATTYQPDSGIPNIIAIGIPDLAALKRVETKLQNHHIPHFSWSEPDYDFGFTAIATAPLTEEQKVVLANYRLLSHRRGGAEQSVCRVMPDSPTNSPVAQAESTGL